MFGKHTSKIAVRTEHCILIHIWIAHTLIHDRAVHTLIHVRTAHILIHVRTEHILITNVRTALMDTPFLSFSFSVKAKATHLTFSKLDWFKVKTE